MRYRYSKKKEGYEKLHENIKFHDELDIKPFIEKHEDSDDEAVVSTRHRFHNAIQGMDNFEGIFCFTKDCK